MSVKYKLELVTLLKLKLLKTMYSQQYNMTSGYRIKFTNSPNHENMAPL